MKMMKLSSNGLGQVFGQVLGAILVAALIIGIIWWLSSQVSATNKAERELRK
jgi:heme/copper-type cytochrome/quinol oxidase subunit 4